MAVLGREGVVRLSREWPAPTALAEQRLQKGADPSLDLVNPAFQSGDEVLLVSLRGVPLGVGINGAAPCPDGHAFWPSGPNELGPVATARTTSGAFWSADSSDPFWESAASVGFQQSATAWIHRDAMDDVRFYDSELNAINGGVTGLVPLRNVSPGPLLILPASSIAGYAASAVALLEAIGSAVIENGEQPADRITTVPALLLDTAADIAERGWLIQCDLTSWVFETDATVLDQDAIGEAFGEYAKGALRGAGSFNGEVDRKQMAGEQAGLALLKLMMMTEQGSRARAEFQLIGGSPRTVYETDILLGKTSVNTQATEVIQLTAEFVATGRIRLGVGA